MSTIIDYKLMFKSGTFVLLKLRGTRLIGVVVDSTQADLFQIKTLYIYKLGESVATDLRTVGGIGGNFSYTSHSNLVKLTDKQVKRKGPMLMLALY